MVGDLVRSLTGIIDKINLRVGELAKYLLPMVGLVLIYEVFARYFLGRPTIWAHEASQHLFGFSIMFGGAYALLHGSHVNVDILVRRFPHRVQAGIACFVFFIIALYFGTMLVKSVPMVIDSWKRMEVTMSVWAPPYYPLKTAVPIGASLLLLQAFSKFLRDLYFTVTGKEVPRP
ncbi:MAG: TRAP transporter small permease subunit [Dehalococcoidales bacterium]|nr:TRAP transporter small permease subunit [Dehalococcoidales bacterium]